MRYFVFLLLIVVTGFYLNNFYEIEKSKKDISFLGDLTQKKGFVNRPENKEKRNIHYQVKKFHKAERATQVEPKSQMNW